MLRIPPLCLNNTGEVAYLKGYDHLASSHHGLRELSRAAVRQPHHPRREVDVGSTSLGLNSSLNAIADKGERT